MKKWQRKQFKKIYSHTRRVMGYCEIFADGLGLKKNKRKQLRKAAEYHDIGKVLAKNCGEEHAAISAEFVEASGITRNPHLTAAIIKAHRGKFDPPPEVWLPAAVLRLSDKLDRFQKGKEDAEDKCRESWKRIKKWCKKNGYGKSRKLAELKAVYKALLREEKMQEAFRAYFFDE